MHNARVMLLTGECQGSCSCAVVPQHGPSLAQVHC
jgi:hypothetical protein